MPRQEFTYQPLPIDPLNPPMPPGFDPLGDFGNWLGRNQVNPLTGQPFIDGEAQAPVRAAPDQLGGNQNISPYIARPPAELPDFEIPAPAFDPGPDAPVLQAPPPRVADPALASREDYMRGRQGRLEGLLESQYNEMKADDPSRRPWWARLGEVAGRIATGENLSDAGVLTEGYFDEERAYRDRLREMLLNQGIQAENLGMDTAEAGFARQSGEHGATQGTAQDRYQTENANVQNRYSNDVRRSEGRNQQNARVADTQARIAAMEYERRMAALSALAGMGGQGGLEASRGMFGDLDPSLQAGADETLRTSGLANVIQQEVAGAGGNAGRARRAIHTRMESMAGRELQRPPRTLTDPGALARFYVQQGVPLTHPDVARAFPGIGSPE